MEDVAEEDQGEGDLEVKCMQLTFSWVGIPHHLKISGI